MERSKNGVKHLAKKAQGLMKGQNPTIESTDKKMLGWVRDSPKFLLVECNVKPNSAVS